MQNIGDTKAGTYIASDRYGNKYYENLEEELPCMFCIFTPERSCANFVNSANAMGRLQRLRIQPVSATVHCASTPATLERPDVICGRLTDSSL